MENNNLKVFTNASFGNVRTLVIHGEPWFVGKDVASVLGYSNPSKALLDHVDTEDKLNNETLLSLGQRGGWLINESGLYSLILSSKLPKAKEFKKWVTSEVLPSLRKNGMYMNESVAKQALENPTEFLARAVLIANEQIQKLSSENVEMKPKAEYFDKLVDTNHLTNLRNAAKELHVPQNKLINLCLHNKALYRDKMGRLLPYSTHSKYFHVKDWSRNGKSGLQTLVTVEGKQYLGNLITREMAVK